MPGTKARGEGENGVTIRPCVYTLHVCSMCAAERTLVVRCRGQRPLSRIDPKSNHISNGMELNHLPKGTSHYSASHPTQGVKNPVCMRLLNLHILKSIVCPSLIPTIFSIIITFLFFILINQYVNIYMTG